MKQSNKVPLEGAEFSTFSENVVWISLAKTFYGFTKSVKGMKSAVLMKFLYQVAP